LGHQCICEEKMAPDVHSKPRVRLFSLSGYLTPLYCVHFVLKTMCAALYIHDQYKYDVVSMK